MTNWPVWFAPVGLVLVLAVAGTGAALFEPLIESLGPGGHRTEHAVSLTASLVQGLAFAGVAFVLARAVASGSAADFGLRGVRLAWLWGGAVGGLAVFLAVGAVWGLLVDTTEQDTLETLGAAESDLLLLLSGALVVLVAPVVEEIFFRGFCFRAVRNRFGFVVSAVSVSTVFGLLHYSGPETLGVIPPLAFLGVMFCWLYERSGSLWPSILLHMLNNTVAFAVTAGPDRAVVVGLGLAALGSAVVTVAALRQPAR